MEGLYEDVHSQCRSCWSVQPRRTGRRTGYRRRVRTKAAAAAAEAEGCRPDTSAVLGQAEQGEGFSGRPG